MGDGCQLSLTSPLMWISDSSTQKLLRGAESKEAAEVMKLTIGWVKWDILQLIF